MHKQSTQKCAGQRRAWLSDKLAATVDFAIDEIYGMQALNGLLMIHVTDSGSNNRGADETGAKGRKEAGVLGFCFVFCSLDQWQKMLAGGAGRSGGLSFYGNKLAGKPL